jgi:molybdopterin/thiamine biosynthesis adenylyltransferase
LAFQLARTGASIIVADGDTVSIENLAGQLYGPSHIGKLKVDALEEMIKLLCESPSVGTIKEYLTDKQSIWKTRVEQSNIICVGFDNLPTRRMVYEHWKANGKEESIFVDGRLNFEEGQVFLLQKNSLPEVYKGYEETYFAPDEAEPIPCTMKATTHCGSIIASFMVSQIVNWCFNCTSPKIKRNVNNIRFILPFNMYNTPKYEVNAVRTEQQEAVVLPT